MNIRTQFLIILLTFLATLIFAQDESADVKPKKTTVTISTPYVKNGWDYYNEGRYTDSIRALLEEKKNYPGRINIYIILGWDYKNLKNYAEMEKVSLEGLNLDNEDIRIISNLAEAYYNQQKYSEAIPYFEKLIAYKNNDQTELGSLYANIGECYYKNNSLLKSDIALSSALYYKPNDLNILALLASLKEKIEDYPKAKLYYQKLLALRPDYPEAVDAIKRLENLKN